MKKKALFILDKSSMNKIYAPLDIIRVKNAVEVYSPVMTYKQVLKNPEVLGECNILLSGWGGPIINEWFLEKAPELEAVFYGAGSIRGIVTPEFWAHNIPITSSWAANAVPVAEYTFAQIILCLKNTYKLNRMYTKDYHSTASSSDKDKKYHEFHNSRRAFGTYKTVVGLISLGMIGRMVCDFLRNLDVDVIAYDPYISPREAEELNVSLVNLDTLFKKSHVVSLHTPWLKETENLIQGEHFMMMRNGGSFINTARGAVVNEKEMIEALRTRTDLTAVLDVTYPEPPHPESELFLMDNVFLTPHIAGSMNEECRRMGKYAIDELYRYLNKEPLKYQITEKKFKTMA